MALNEKILCLLNFSETIYNKEHIFKYAITIIFK